MNYTYIPYDPNRYSANLRRDGETRNLIWDATPGLDALVIQTGFGVPVDPMGPELCEKLSQLERDLPPMQYIEVLPNVWVCYVSAGDRIRNLGCPLRSEAHTYSVLTCLPGGAGRQVCAPAPNGTLDIPLDFPVTVQLCYATVGGLFKRRQEPNGFYSLTLPRELANGFPDGELVYQAEGVQVPITGEMIAFGTVYVRTPRPPEIVAMNPGIRPRINN